MEFRVAIDALENKGDAQEMTRYEAIDALSERIRIIEENGYPLQEYREALEMAVKALEDIPKYRKAKKRWKRKYMSLRMKVWGKT